MKINWVCQMLTRITVKLKRDTSFVIPASSVFKIVML